MGLPGYPVRNGMIRIILPILPIHPSTEAVQDVPKEDKQLALLSAVWFFWGKNKSHPKDTHPDEIVYPKLGPQNEDIRWHIQH